jgi:predicted Zn-dependent protease
MRLVIAGVLVLVAIGGYFLNSSTNPITGQDQRVGGKTVQQEIALGYQAAPEMAQQFGGRSGNDAGQAMLEQIGADLVRAIPAVYAGADSLAEVPFEFSFTLLDDDQTVNAFALPGGPTFITDALFDQLTPGQVAGVMGHEIVHVIQRHGLQRMAKQNLLQGIAGAATTAAGDYSAGQVTQMVGNFLQMSYGRDQELECDHEGLLLMVEAGYDPRGMLGVMQVLSEASGGRSTPEWASTHPAPENRLQKIQDHIDEIFPNGIPDGLIQ